MNTDDFQYALATRYSEDINQALLQCETIEGDIDYDALQEKLQSLMHQASVDGIEDDLFEDLVETALPGVYARLGLQVKKAA